MNIRELTNEQIDWAKNNRVAWSLLSDDEKNILTTFNFDDLERWDDRRWWPNPVDYLFDVSAYRLKSNWEKTEEMYRRSIQETVAGITKEFDNRGYRLRWCDENNTVSLEKTLRVVVDFSGPVFLLSDYHSIMYQLLDKFELCFRESFCGVRFLLQKEL